MALGVRQQGEIAYLRGALGLDDLERRLAKLEGDDDFVGLSLEERHSRGLANLAELPSTTMTPFSPEGEPDPERDENEEVELLAGTVDENETVQESHPATAGTESNVALDELLAEQHDYEDLSVDELKALLRGRGQPVSGTKAELIDRLEQGDLDEA